MSLTKINKGIYKLQKIDIALEQLQLNNISIDFPTSLKFFSNSFISWYQNVNKKYAQLNKAHKFFGVRIFKLKVGLSPSKKISVFLLQ